MSSMPQIKFTPELLAQLKKEYKQAVIHGKESFMFSGQVPGKPGPTEVPEGGYELVTNFAKYLIEYLDIEFRNKKR